MERSGKESSDKRENRDIVPFGLRLVSLANAIRWIGVALMDHFRGMVKTLTAIMTYFERMPKGVAESMTMPGSFLAETADYISMNE